MCQSYESYLPENLKIDIAEVLKKKNNNESVVVDRINAWSVNARTFENFCVKDGCVDKNLLRAGDLILPVSED